MADQWFAIGEDTDFEDARRVARLLHTDLEPRFVALCEDPGSLTADEAEKEFHRLRGGISSFGFSRCSAHLLRLEKEWGNLSLEERGKELRAALESFRAGVAELLERFPHLKGN